MMQVDQDLHPLFDVTAAIKERRLKLATRHGYLNYFQNIILLVIVVFIAFTQVFIINVAEGTDMFPAILDGDILLSYRLDRNYLKDDVVICNIDGKTVIGRVVARGGDRVDITEEGILYVNGTEQTGEIAFPTFPGKQDYPYVVPNNCVFLLGDFRTNTKDSRDFGPVDISDVQAKVINVFRHRGI